MASHVDGFEIGFHSSLSEPVTIAGVTFTPGRHVWADADGILVER